MAYLQQSSKNWVHQEASDSWRVTSPALVERKRTPNTNAELWPPRSFLLPTICLCLSTTIRPLHIQKLIVRSQRRLYSPSQRTPVSLLCSSHHPLRPFVLPRRIHTLAPPSCLRTNLLPACWQSTPTRSRSRLPWPRRRSQTATRLTIPRSEWQK